MKPVVVVVDAFGGLCALVAALHERNAFVIALTCLPQALDLGSPCDLADLQLACPEDDLDAAVSMLRPYRVDDVIAASEPHVEWAEALACALGCRSNDAATSAHRRHKGAMQRQLAASGTPSIPTWTVRSLVDLQGLRGELSGRVVVKPTSSMGNDGLGFFDLRTPEGPSLLVHHVDTLLGSRDVGGRLNEEVIVQQHMRGTEYVVNTVTLDGRHLVTDCWRYLKIVGPGGADRIAAALSVAPGDVLRNVREVALASLDALGVRHGAGHCEILDDPSGAVLVEVGARPSGADTARFARLSMGQSQLDWLATAVTDADAFAAALDAPLPLVRHVAWYFLTCDVEGTFHGFPRLGQVENLDSFQFFVARIQPGEMLSPTVDEVGEPGHVALAHHDEATLWRDLMTLFHLDGSGFYKVAP